MSKNKDKLKDKTKEKLQKNVDDNLKKGKCLELVTVYIDNSIVSFNTSQKFMDKLTSLSGPQYEIKSDSCLDGNLHNLIKWVTKSQKVIPVGDSWAIDTTYSIDERCIMLICGNDFIDLIKGCCTGLQNIKSIANLISEIKHSNLKPSLIVFDIEFELLKLKKKQSKRKAVPSETNEITSETIDSVLLDLQMDHRLTSWKVAGLEEAAEIVCCYTKTVAERPYKAQLSNKTSDLFSFTISKEVCTRISSDRGADKFGGVDQLWRHQLAHFSGVKDDTINAIVTIYPTPMALYDDMVDISESLGEKVAMEKIANIDVRRGTELLATSRKVGKEVAKRIYEFITSMTDENCNIY